MIYLVEDDSGIRDLMIYALKASGFEAEGFERSDGFLEGARKSFPSLLFST